MSHDGWEAVDRYLADALVPPDPALAAAQRASDAAGLPPHQVTAAQGRLLALLARAAGAREILEIGTLGGYSTIWLARALPAGGRLISLELDPRYAEVARANLDRAGVGDRVEVRVGPAAASLAQLAAEHRGPFDLIFIDADKQSNPEYLEGSLAVARPGTLIVADNVVREGGLLDEQTTDPTIRGIRRFFQMLGADPRVEATAIQTVGTKGWDGFAFARVR
jgi:predicted O-methyltransferase YrrM